MIRKILLILTLSIVGTNAFATEYTGTVKGVVVNGFGHVTININGGNQPAPNCAPGLWQFSFDLAKPGAKEWFSMLLTARATNTVITVGYGDKPTGVCEVSYLMFLY